MSGERLADVLVVGGGPAGLSAAITLRCQGASVMVCEAQTYPHDKLCGEFLSPECRPVLEALGVWPRLHALRPPAISHARFTAPSGAVWNVQLPAPALGLSRRALDAALAEVAQGCEVELHTGTTVNAIHGSLEDGFEVQARQAGRLRTFRARLVIGAHGKRAALDRNLARSFLQQPAPFVALKAHFQGPPLPGRVQLNIFPGGYCGFSEIESDLRDVCLLVHAPVFGAVISAGRKNEHPAETFIAWMRTQNPHLQDWLSQALCVSPRWISISQVPFGEKQPVENGVLMAGDAAGLIVPLAGDGIAMALEGGLLAASYAGRFLQGTYTAGALQSEYSAAWHKRFDPRLRLGRRLQPLLLRPQVFEFALRGLRLLPPLGRYLVAHTRSPISA